MHRTGTERKTDPKRLPEQDRQQKQRTQDGEAASQWAQTLSVLLAGNSLDQLPQERIFGLSNVMGNSALYEVLSMRSAGLRFSERALPDGTCDTAPMASDAAGEPAFAEGLSAAPIGTVQPMTVS